MTEERLRIIEARPRRDSTTRDDIDALLAEAQRLHLFETWLGQFKAFEAEAYHRPASGDDIARAQYIAIRFDRRILIRQIEDVLAGKWEVSE
jgi:hypothetical protein